VPARSATIVLIIVEILKHFNLSQVVLLKMDTLDSTIAGCLSQTNTSFELLRSVTFYSKKLILMEEKYNIGNKKLLSIVESL
jgi:hypothetical protein